MALPLNELPKSAVVDGCPLYTGSAVMFENLQFSTLRSQWWVMIPLNNEWYDASNSMRVDGTASLNFEWYYDQTGPGSYLPSPSNGLYVSPVGVNSATVLCSDYANFRISGDETNTVVNALRSGPDSTGYYQNIVNSINQNKIQQGLPLSYQDSIVLINIAYLLYAQAGDAKYFAAAMLGLEIHREYYSGNKQQLVKAIELNTISVYPNPTNDYFKLYSVYDEIVLIEIYDLNGKLLKSIRENEKDKINRINFVQGIYQMKITESNSKISFAKLVIIK